MTKLQMTALAAVLLFSCTLVVAVRSQVSFSGDSTRTTSSTSSYKPETDYIVDPAAPDSTSVPVYCGEGVETFLDLQQKLYRGAKQALERNGIENTFVVRTQIFYALLYMEPNKFTEIDEDAFLAKIKELLEENASSNAAQVYQIIEPAIENTLDVLENHCKTSLSGSSSPSLTSSNETESTGTVTEAGTSSSTSGTGSIDAAPLPLQFKRSSLSHESSNSVEVELRLHLNSISDTFEFVYTFDGVTSDPGSCDIEGERVDCEFKLESLPHNTADQQVCVVITEKTSQAQAEKCFTFSTYQDPSICEAALQVHMNECNHYSDSNTETQTVDVEEEYERFMRGGTAFAFLRRPNCVAAKVQVAECMQTESNPDPKLTLRASIDTAVQQKMEATFPNGADHDPCLLLDYLKESSTAHNCNLEVGKLSFHSATFEELFQFKLCGNILDSTSRLTSMCDSCDVQKSLETECYDETTLMPGISSTCATALKTHFDECVAPKFAASSSTTDEHFMNLTFAHDAMKYFLEESGIETFNVARKELYTTCGFGENAASRVVIQDSSVLCASQCSSKIGSFRETFRERLNAALRSPAIMDQMSNIRDLYREHCVQEDSTSAQTEGQTRTPEVTLPRPGKLSFDAETYTLSFEVQPHPNSPATRTFRLCKFNGCFSDLFEGAGDATVITLENFVPPSRYSYLAVQEVMGDIKSFKSEFALIKLPSERPEKMTLRQDPEDESLLNGFMMPQGGATKVEAWCHSGPLDTLTSTLPTGASSSEDSEEGDSTSAEAVAPSNFGSPVDVTGPSERGHYSLSIEAPEENSFVWCIWRFKASEGESFGPWSDHKVEEAKAKTPPLPEGSIQVVNILSTSADVQITFPADLLTKTFGCRIIVKSDGQELTKRFMSSDMDIPDSGIVTATFQGLRPALPHYVEAKVREEGKDPSESSKAVMFTTDAPEFMPLKAEWFDGPDDTQGMGVGDELKITFSLPAQDPDNLQLFIITKSRNADTGEIESSSFDIASIFTKSWSSDNKVLTLTVDKEPSADVDPIRPKYSHVSLVEEVPKPESEDDAAALEDFENYKKMRTLVVGDYNNPMSVLEMLATSTGDFTRFRSGGDSDEASADEESKSGDVGLTSAAGRSEGEEASDVTEPSLNIVIRSMSEDFDVMVDEGSTKRLYGMLRNSKIESASEDDTVNLKVSCANGGLLKFGGDEESAFTAEVSKTDLKVSNAIRALYHLQYSAADMDSDEFDNCYIDATLNVDPPVSVSKEFTVSFKESRQSPELEFGDDIEMEAAGCTAVPIEIDAPEATEETTIRVSLSVDDLGFSRSDFLKRVAVMLRSDDEADEASDATTAPPSLEGKATLKFTGEAASTGVEYGVAFGTQATRLSISGSLTALRSALESLEVCTPEKSAKGMYMIEGRISDKDMIESSDDEGHDKLKVKVAASCSESMVPDIESIFLGFERHGYISIKFTSNLPQFLRKGRKSCADIFDSATMALFGDAEKTKCRFPYDQPDRIIVGLYDRDHTVKAGSAITIRESQVKFCSEESEVYLKGSGSVEVSESEKPDPPKIKLVARRDVLHYNQDLYMTVVRKGPSCECEWTSLPTVEGEAFGDGNCRLKVTSANLPLGEVGTEFSVVCVDKSFMSRSNEESVTIKRLNAPEPEAEEGEESTEPSTLVLLGSDKTVRLSKEYVRLSVRPESRVAVEFGKWTLQETVEGFDPDQTGQSLLLSPAMFGTGTFHFTQTAWPTGHEDMKASKTIKLTIEGEDIEANIAGSDDFEVFKSDSIILKSFGSTDGNYALSAVSSTTHTFSWACFIESEQAEDEYTQCIKANGESFQEQTTATLTVPGNTFVEGVYLFKLTICDKALATRCDSDIASVTIGGTPKPQVRIRFNQDGDDVLIGVRTRIWSDYTEYTTADFSCVEVLTATSSSGEVTPLSLDDEHAARLDSTAVQNLFQHGDTLVLSATVTCEGMDPGSATKSITMAPAPSGGRLEVTALGDKFTAEALDWVFGAQAEPMYEFKLDGISLAARGESNIFEDIMVSTAGVHTITVIVYDVDPWNEPHAIVTEEFIVEESSVAVASDLEELTYSEAYTLILSLIEQEGELDAESVQLICDTYQESLAHLESSLTVNLVEKVAEICPDSVELALTAVQAAADIEPETRIQAFGELVQSDDTQVSTSRGGRRLLAVENTEVADSLNHAALNEIESLLRKHSNENFETVGSHSTFTNNLQTKFFHVARREAAEYSSNVGSATVTVRSELFANHADDVIHLIASLPTTTFSQSVAATGAEIEYFEAVSTTVWFRIENTAGVHITVSSSNLVEVVLPVTMNTCADPDAIFQCRTFDSASDRWTTSNVITKSSTEAGKIQCDTSTGEGVYVAVFCADNTAATAPTAETSSPPENADNTGNTNTDTGNGNTDNTDNTNTDNTNTDTGNTNTDNTNTDTEATKNQDGTAVLEVVRVATTLKLTPSQLKDVSSFQESFAEDIHNAVGISKDRVVVRSYNEDTGALEFDVLPPKAGQDQEISASDAVNLIEDQMLSFSSTLRGGKVTNAMTSALRRSNASVVSCSDGTYEDTLEACNATEEPKEDESKPSTTLLAAGAAGLVALIVLALLYRKKKRKEAVERARMEIGTGMIGTHNVGHYTMGSPTNVMPPAGQQFTAQPVFTAQQPFMAQPNVMMNGYQQQPMI